MPEIAVIANITEQSWILQRTYGTFLVRGCDGAHAKSGAVIPSEARSSHSGEAPSRGTPRERNSSTAGAPQDAPSARNHNGARYALTEITPRKGIIDLGDKRTLDFPISARDIAEDLAREINSDAGENSFLGVFVCAGAQPTAQELDAAHRRLEDFYSRQVAIADQEWERTHNFMIINDVERRAARWLGLEKEWSYEPKPLVDCPACGEKLKPGVAVCRSCGAVLDREKAAQFGLAAVAIEPVVQGVGASAPTERLEKRPGASAPEAKNRGLRG